MRLITGATVPKEIEGDIYTPNAILVIRAQAQADILRSVLAAYQMDKVDMGEYLRSMIRMYDDRVERMRGDDE